MFALHALDSTSFLLSLHNKVSHVSPCKVLVVSSKHGHLLFSLGALSEVFVHEGDDQVDSGLVSSCIVSLVDVLELLYFRTSCLIE